MKFKILSIALIISILVLITSIGASAFSNTGNVSPTTPMSYVYSKSSFASHKTRGYNYNYVSGTFFDAAVGIPLSTEKASAKYSYKFQVATSGMYYLTYNFKANTELDKFQIYIDDLDNFSTFGDFLLGGTETKYGNQVQLMPSELKVGHTYQISLVFAESRISLFSPVTYSCDFGISYSSSGQQADVDAPVTIDKANTLILESIDEQGRYWYRYNGISYSSNASTSGYTGTYSVVRGEDAVQLSASAQGSNNSYSSSYYAMTKYSLNASVIQAPISGTYQIGYYVGSATGTKISDGTALPVVLGLNAAQTLTPKLTLPITQTYPVTGLYDYAGVLKSQGEYLTNWTELGVNQNGNLTYGFRCNQGSKVTINDLRLYVVVTPVQPFTVTQYNYTIDNSTHNVNEVTTQNGSSMQLTFPDTLGAWGQHSASSWSWSDDLQQLNFITNDGYNGSFIYTGNSINIQYVKDGQTYQYIFTYDDCEKGVDNKGSTVDDPTTVYDRSSGGGSGGFWDFITDVVLGGIKAALTALFNGIATFFTNILTGINNFFSSMFGFIGDGITSFFDLFSGDDSPLGDIQDDVLDDEQLNPTGAIAIIGSFISVIPAPIMTVLTFFFVISAVFIVLKIVGKRD